MLHFKHVKRYEENWLKISASSSQTKISFEVSLSDHFLINEHYLGNAKFAFFKNCYMQLAVQLCNFHVTVTPNESFLKNFIFCTFSFFSGLVSSKLVLTIKQRGLSLLYCSYDWLYDWFFVSLDIDYCNC